MTNLQKAQNAKKENVLNTLIRYSNYGVMTRKKWLELQFNKGNKVEISTKNRIQYDRRKYNRMTCYKEQEDYEKKCAEQVTCYILTDADKSFWYITKTEYDYFLNLN